MFCIFSGEAGRRRFSLALRARHLGDWPRPNGCTEAALYSECAFNATDYLSPETVTVLATALITLRRHVRARRQHHHCRWSPYLRRPRFLPRRVHRSLSGHHMRRYRAVRFGMAGGLVETPAPVSWAKHASNRRTGGRDRTWSVRSPSPASYPPHARPSTSLPASSTPPCGATSRPLSSPPWPTSSSSSASPCSSRETIGARFDTYRWLLLAIPVCLFLVRTAREKLAPPHANQSKTTPGPSQTPRSRPPKEPAL